MNYTKEINQEELKNFICSNKASKFVLDGCILEPKLGRVVFDLYEFKWLEACQLHVRRISGNGKIIINGDTNISVLSKISQCFDLTVKSNKIEITRPADSTGEICIFGITVGLNSMQEETVLGTNWKVLIAKCGKYNCLRMVDNRLFASEGAYIDNANIIKSIETYPLNMTIRSGDRLKFLGSCEIVDLVIDSNATLIKDSIVYTHRMESFPQIHSPQITDPIKQLSASAPGYFNQSQSLKKDMSHVNIIFDSNSSGTFKSYNNGRLIKFINSNGKNYLLLKKGGSFSIPISTIVSDKNYIAILNLKKLNGNGKVSIGFAFGSSQPTSYKTIIAESFEKDNYTEVSTGSFNYPGEHFKLTVSLLDDSLGEVLISRIILVENLPMSFINSVPITIENVSGSIENRIFNPVEVNGLLSSKKRFVIVIPSYNNVKWCEKNITSVINQNYDNYRVIFVDDCSPDGTFSKVSETVNASSKSGKFTLIKNTVRIGALANLYNMIHSCDDDEIIVTLDGDDWLAHDNVIGRLNEAYSSNDVWMTYGQFQNYPDGGHGFAQQIPNNVVKDGSYRQYTWCSTHLRTFYSWLFKNINKNDLFYDGNFMTMTWDMAMIFPMLEMSGNKSKFINEILYIYNLDNPINDHKVNIKLQQDLDRYVRRLPKYKKLETPIIINNKIGLMLIATGRYHEYIQGLISSADNYFLKGFDVTYYLFSETEHNIRSDRPIIKLPIQHRSFPFASMDRFKHFTKYAEILSKEKYLYYIDVDCLFVDHVSSEILGGLVGVTHCGYLNKQGPIENNIQSVFYLDDMQASRYRYYFGGGFSGGKSGKYLELAKWCDEMIDKDVNNGIIPIFHDETAINRYFLDHEPDTILSPSYHYPQSNINHYKNIWNGQNFDPKILLLDKNHLEMRK